MPHIRDSKLPDQINVIHETCGRCNGSGRIPMLYELPAAFLGDSDGTTWCPICKGEGIQPTFQPVDGRAAHGVQASGGFADGVRSFSTGRAPRE